MGYVTGIITFDKNDNYGAKQIIKNGQYGNSC